MRQPLNQLPCVHSVEHDMIHLVPATFGFFRETYRPGPGPWLPEKRKQKGVTPPGIQERHGTAMKRSDPPWMAVQNHTNIVDPFAMAILDACCGFRRYIL